MKALASIALLAILSGCASAGTSPAVMTQAGTAASAGLASYRAALGIAEQAEASNPAVAAKIAAVAAKAAPYVADAGVVASQASTAPTLSALAAELLLDAAPYIVAVPAK